MSLPPLSAVRVFEAVARHLSFTRAAEELGMTQAAVSYQIKLLEERIGAPLFLRKPRQIALSDVGTKLAPPVRQAFELMREAFAETRGEVDGLLSISSVVTFASQWLAQNLGLFQLAHPEIAVRLDSGNAMADLVHGEFDIGIRSLAEPQGNGLVAHLLVKSDFTPLLSPTLAASVGGIRRPEDLLKLPMLDAEDEWVEQWFSAAGVPGYNPSGRASVSFGVQSLLGTAAMAGQGVTMLTPAFFRDEIASGRLYQPFDLLAPAGRGYYLVYAESRRNAPKIRAFRDWMLAATRFMREPGTPSADTPRGV
ncbi:LysR family transcriptional regulator [Nostoc sp. 3335mG]|nr:LysR family transcriptional regulator [Nostoc sp. 3335mG]